MQSEPVLRRSIVESSDREGDDAEDSDDEEDEQAPEQDLPRISGHRRHSTRLPGLNCDMSVLIGHFFGTTRQDKSVTRFPAIHPTSPFMTGPASPPVPSRQWLSRVIVEL